MATAYYFKVQGQLIEGPPQERATPYSNFPIRLTRGLGIVKGSINKEIQGRKSQLAEGEKNVNRDYMTILRESNQLNKLETSLLSNVKELFLFAFGTRIQNNIPNVKSQEI